MKNLINLNNNQLIFITLILLPLIILLICSFNKKNNYENFDTKEDFDLNTFLKNLGVSETETDNIPVVNMIKEDEIVNQPKKEDEIVNQPEKKDTYDDEPIDISTDKKDMDVFNKQIPILNQIRITKLAKHNKKTDFDLKSRQCQFYNKKCPDGFTSLGTFSLLDDSTLLFGDDKKFSPAKAVANISDGKITDIKMIDNGSGYTDAPKVSIIGDCKKNAYGRCIIDDLGSVVAIDITDNGDGYKNKPQIKIDVPEVSQYYMCCN